MNITQDILEKLIGNLSIKGMYHLNILIEYTSMNSFVTRLAFSPKVVTALGLYQAMYFIKTVFLHPEGFYKFLLNLKGHFLRINTLITKVSSSFIPNIRLYYGVISGGVLGIFYSLGITNTQTGFMWNLVKKMPQLDICDGIQKQYKLPMFLESLKTFFTVNFIPAIYHSASISSEMTKAAILGCFGENNMRLLQKYVNSIKK